MQDQPYRLFLTQHQQHKHCRLVLFGHASHCDPLGTTHTGHSISVFSAVMQLMCRATALELDEPIRMYYWSALGSSRQRLYRLLMKKVALDLGWSHSQQKSLFPGNVGSNEECYLIYQPGFVAAD